MSRTWAVIRPSMSDTGPLPPLPSGAGAALRAAARSLLPDGGPGPGGIGRAGRDRHAVGVGVVGRLIRVDERGGIGVLVGVGHADRGAGPDVRRASTAL